MERASHVRGGREDIMLLLREFDNSCDYERDARIGSSEACSSNRGAPFSFARFKYCWKKLSFGIILHCCPPGIQHVEFLQELCATALGKRNYHRQHQQTSIAATVYERGWGGVATGTVRARTNSVDLLPYNSYTANRAKASVYCRRSLHIILYISNSISVVGSGPALHPS